jgi:hypothetical protein
LPPQESNEVAPGPARNDRLQKLLAGEWPNPPEPAAIEPYLEANRRAAETLLAAVRVTGDKKYLQEALDRFPTNRLVALEAYHSATTPEERRRWIDSFKQAAPGNALGHYLSAREHFATGQTDAGITELMAASSAPAWSTFARESILNAEEAYRASGSSEVEAKVAAGLGLPLPHLAKLRELGNSLRELADSYQAAGDEASARATLQLGLTLANRISNPVEPTFTIDKLVSIATEAKLLEGVAPETAYDEGGRTVAQRLEELQRQKEQLKGLGKETGTILEKISEPDLLQFMERWETLGEPDAVQWYRSRRGEP